ncbi:NAD(P)/FAD-dependent oxidoreductase [Comamonas sp. JC664]|uniref:NAD(P)/FAD-dependent oxidoreductase n=1 Tax=Comamonas sp. JC664 TaxID=2801917 RepID=UPI003622DB64
MAPASRLEYDVVIVGGGPGGLATAIRLKQLAAEKGSDVSVVVLEKGSEPGAHTLSGAIMDPRALTELIPDWKAKGAPLTQPVTEDAMIFLSEKSGLRTPNWLLPPCFHNEGNYIVQLALSSNGWPSRPRPWASRFSPALPPLKWSITTTARSRAWPPATWASARTASPPASSSWAWSCMANTPSLPKARAATWASN